MPAWSLDQARHTYSIPYWSEGYYDVDAAGRMVVRPRGPGGPELALPEVVERATAEGLKLPLLLRFADILGDRLGKLRAAFARAMAELDYAGGYTAVYPIKVNQHRGVAGTLAAAGGEGFGLEAGSKPELMAVLGLARPGSLVVCNGYKDREFIRLALIGRKLGLETFIVIEKPSELDLVIEQARDLGVQPGLGVRMRLASIGAGKWQNSGGDKAKFGLSPRQVLDLVERLRAAGMLPALRLLHFHMGSQISNVRDIANGMREAVRYFVELSKMGCGIRYMDSGGGLGVDYEGTRSRGFCSINYGLDQYAHTLVQPLAEACAEHGLTPPRLVTEAGRAMTAHHAVMVVNVSEVEPAPEGAVPPEQPDEPPVLRHLRETHAALGQRPPLELYHEAQHHLAEGQALYALGQLTLPQRAMLDDLFYAVAHAVRARLTAEERSHRDVLDELNERLVDKYFVNFSVFESIPDVWAIDQVFPIVPIARLDEKPERRGVIADLTCDSDGRVDTYVESEALDSSLPLHAPRPGESYRLGIFMVGAYQETLGDIHNLFGDTDTANVVLDADGSYSLSRQRKGDTTDVMLDYVGYDLQELRAAYKQKVDAANLEPVEAARLLVDLEAGLTGYTYLHEENA
ncbi:arginine decarboxylase [Arenimonas fontis]|uniref:Biosynthetic arginine decarboxylase n=1 Tax=Arenimonas fontis TaxID=2608255 RepID=A0A5B2ZAS4_9GAMM|nr:arginine decarboxylase [Arenimonas fontis]KAA2284241.1 arginine decarboxylase [Arenimonas fontis]